MVGWTWQKAGQPTASDKYVRSASDCHDSRKPGDALAYCAGKFCGSRKNVRSHRHPGDSFRRAQVGSYAGLILADATALNRVEWREFKNQAKGSLMAACRNREV